MKVGYKTDIGNVREKNEDSVLANRKIGLFIVADGNGRNGDIASRITVSSIDKYIRKALINKRRVNIFNIIKTAIEDPNDKIFLKSFKNPKFSGGSTIALALKYQQKIYIANIGDSRIYLIRKGEIIQLTHDHSLVGWLVRKGKITKSGARIHPMRNVITDLVGNPKEVNPYMTSIKWQKNDYYLLCSDGLTNSIDDNHIKRIIINIKSPQKICDELIRTALEQGGQDNISVIALLFEGGDE